ncbi:hypothetical protein Holit_03332 [Hollandina sp. SP2]
MPYDGVFRKRVIAYKDAGHTFKDVNEAFGVDSKGYYSRKKQFEQTGSLEKESPKERKGKINKRERARLREDHPDWYLRAFEEKFNDCPQGIPKMVERYGVMGKEKRLPIEKSRRKDGKRF